MQNKMALAHQQQQQQSNTIEFSVRMRFVLARVGRFGVVTRRQSGVVRAVAAMKKMGGGRGEDRAKRKPIFIQHARTHLLTYSFGGRQKPPSHDIQMPSSSTTIHDFVSVNCYSSWI